MPAAGNNYPLLQRDPASPIVLAADGSVVTTAEFLCQLSSLAKQLPDADYVLNLCASRYHFLLCFCAALLRGQSNLLPPGRGEGLQRELCASYPGAYIVHDGAPVIADVRSQDIRPLLAVAAGPNRPQVNDVPVLPGDQLAAIVFTSGSTGTPSAIKKSWHTFYASTQLNASYMLGEKPHYSMLATVPGQHMYGLETSILLPLLNSLTVFDGQPLFPRDVQQALQLLPPPRVLVSSPVHLRALLSSGLNFPKADIVLSATAPLDPALGKQVEDQFAASMCEIYGCSEAGSLAYRNPAVDEDWQLFSAFNFSADDNLLHAAHLAEPVALQDRLEFTAGKRFRLAGRASDMVNIAGKRGSLQQLNQVLLQADGVLDAAVFIVPPELAGARHDAARGDCLAALVVGEPADRRAIAAHLRRFVDPALVPRHINFVHALPRSETGKLPRDRLLAEFVRQRKGG